MGDKGNPQALGTFDSTLTTLTVSLVGVAENTVNLSFDSSWRPEFDTTNQSASLSVQFDSGASTELFRWVADGGDPNFKATATNESLSLALNNPAGANEMILNFDLFDAGNDWWWAIDNVNVEGGIVPEPSVALLIALGGLTVFYGRRR